MVEVGVRELKAKLSYYLQLMQAGEEIAIKVRHRVVGYLSRLSPPSPKKGKIRRRGRREMRSLIEQWKREGYLLSGGLCRYRPVKTSRMSPGPTSTEMIRQMRDEGL